MKNSKMKIISIFLTFLTIALVVLSVFVMQRTGEFIPIESTNIALYAAASLGTGQTVVPAIDPISEPTPVSDPVSVPLTEPELEPEQESETEQQSEQEPESETEPETEPEHDPIVTVTISAAGDVTLGGCPSGASYATFMRVFAENGNDHSFLLRNVRHIFFESDISVVNLEGTLTDETRHRGSSFNFRAPPEFAMSLSAGGVDIVSLANNHSNDFFEQGYKDTIENLEAEGIASFGNKRNTIIEVNGVKVGFFGFLTWTDNRDHRNNVTAAINDLRNRGADLVIAFYHWGQEKHFRPNSSQINLGRFTIDSGADLVLGAHPHVVQGIEEYKGRNIVYSLGNFSFGGNRTPYDMDAFIFQQTFTFDNGVLQADNETNIIPVRTTSAGTYNNYQPTPAYGTDYERIMGVIQRLTNELN